MSTPQQVPSAEERESTRYVERREILETRAKAAYGVYAHRAGLTTPWEHLPPEQMAAWREVLEFLDDEPECSKCGDALLCMDCDARQVGEIITQVLDSRQVGEIITQALKRTD